MSTHPIRVAALTVSDSRTPQDDEGGARLRERLEAAGFTVTLHEIVRDDAEAIRAFVARVSDGDLADAVISTGGTGIAPRDVTYEAVDGLLEKRLDGFGEAFRRLSWDQVGARSVLSRAVAGVHRSLFVAALPGSPKAVVLAVDALLAPMLGHAVALLRGRAKHHGAS
jgi:molybdenum cofactor biosynthesis protein B